MNWFNNDTTQKVVNHFIGSQRPLMIRFICLWMDSVIQNIKFDTNEFKTMRHWCWVLLIRLYTKNNKIIHQRINLNIIKNTWNLKLCASNRTHTTERRWRRWQRVLPLWFLISFHVTKKLWNSIGEITDDEDIVSIWCDFRGVDEEEHVRERTKMATTRVFNLKFFNFVIFNFVPL